MGAAQLPYQGLRQQLWARPQPRGRRLDTLPVGLLSGGCVLWQHQQGTGVQEDKEGVEPDWGPW